MIDGERRLKPTILREFIKYCSANVLSMVALSAYILIDTFFIAREMGSDGLAALNLAIPMYNIMFAFGLMVGIGGATRYNVLKSRGNIEGAHRVFTASAMIIFAASVFFMLIGFYFADVLTWALGADDIVFKMSRDYLRIILLSSPLFLTTVLLTSFLRNDGAPITAMGSMLLSSMSNIVFDYILIVRMQMGMRGAALATTYAATLGLLFVFIYIAINGCSFRLVRQRVAGKTFARIFSIGLPACITEGSLGIVIISFNLIMMRFLGNTGVAAYALIANISVVLFAIYNGLAQGIQPLISRNYAIGNTSNIRAVMRYAFFCSAGISALFYAFAFFGADIISTAFNRDNDMLFQETAVPGIRIFFAGCFFACFNIIISTYFAATEQARPAQIFTVLRGFLFIIPTALLLSSLFGVTGVWLSLPVTEVIVLLIAISYYFKRKGGSFGY